MHSDPHWEKILKLLYRTTKHSAPLLIVAALRPLCSAIASLPLHLAVRYMSEANQMPFSLENAV